MRDQARGHFFQSSRRLPPGLPPRPPGFAGGLFFVESCTGKVNRLIVLEPVPGNPWEARAEPLPVSAGLSGMGLSGMQGCHIMHSGSNIEVRSKVLKSSLPPGEPRGMSSCLGLLESWNWLRVRTGVFSFGLEPDPRPGLTPGIGPGVKPGPNPK